MAFMRAGEIKESMRVFIAACFYYSGLVKLALWWMQRSGQRLIILNYHRATGGDLRSQLLYLRRHYRLMHLEEALEEFYLSHRGEKRMRNRRIPLVLTFDDGYRDNYTFGFSLARELAIPMTVFLVPGYIESGKPFWWLEVERLVRHTQANEVTIEGCTYHIGQSEERRALIQTIFNFAYNAKSVAEREAFLEDARKALAVPSSATEEEATLPLTWAEVREMEESGFVSFGAHSMHHPNLEALTDPAEVWQEVEECHIVLEQRLGHPVRSFAYPFGKVGGQGLRAAKEAGYAWALTCIDETNTPQTNPHLIRRLPGRLNVHWLVLASELVGLLGVLSRSKKTYRARAEVMRIWSGKPVEVESGAGYAK